MQSQQTTQPIKLKFPLFLATVLTVILTILFLQCGSTIPPMHIFPWVHCSYNAIKASVDGAYFGKSDSGWINQELFYGWLTNHFVRYTIPHHPVCLLSDGHSSDIDLETSSTCI